MLAPIAFESVTAKVSSGSMSESPRTLTMIVLINAMTDAWRDWFQLMATQPNSPFVDQLQRRVAKV